MATARDIITRAMKACRLLAPGELPSASEASDGLLLLNMMLSSWSNDNLNVYASTLESFPLVANTGSYNIGTGQTFNTTKPIVINAMYTRQSSVDYTVNQLNDIDFAGISFKSITGRPDYYNFSNDYPSAIIKLYPVPDENYTLFILSEKPLSSIATLDTVINFPDGWELALAYNLALMLSPEYQQPIDANMVKIANDAKMSIRRAVNRNKVYTSEDNSFVDKKNIYNGFF